MKSAKTTHQYQLLASWFKQREDLYRSKAAAEAIQYQKLLSTNAAWKYPAPSDVAKRRYEYDMYKAEQMAKLASQYEQNLQRREEVGSAAVTDTRSSGTR
jgi:hypothetical protein